MSDRIFGFVVLVITAMYAYGALQIQESFMAQAVGPKVMPLALCGLAVICAIYFILRPDDEPSWPATAGWLEIGAAILAMYAYAHALPHLGFLIASVIICAYLCWRFGANLIESLIGAVAISCVLYGIFDLGLGLSLTKGPFGF